MIFLPLKSGIVLFLLYFVLGIDLQKQRKRYFTMDRNIELEQFYEYLTRLNYFRDLGEKGYHPTNIEDDENKFKFDDEQLKFEPVPLRFSSQKNYVALWKKLFYEETKAQLVKSKLQEQNPWEEMEFVNFTVLGKFKLLNFKKTQASKMVYTPSQLVVLSPKKSLKGLTAYYPHLVGITQGSSDPNVQVRVFLEEHCFSKQNFQIVNTSKKWFIQSVTSITTLERIYKALHGFGRINPLIKELLLRPDLHNKEVEKKFAIPDQLDKQLQSAFNDSQYKAIHESLKQQGITLIQGPPGTGKTKTVLGTLSVLLGSLLRPDDEDDQQLVLSWKKSSKKIKQEHCFNPWLKGNFVDWRDEPYIDSLQTQLNLTKTYLKSQQTDLKIMLKNNKHQIQLPGKVLVCGPSNAAVDEIIRKLLNQKLFDKQGKKYVPKFVRIGDNFDSSLSEYSLEELAIKECNKKTQGDMNFEKMKILKDYRLVFGTLSSVGHQIVSNADVSFDTVIIDEAGQSIEIENLIPLLFNCKRLILIGDPNQLPATVFSRITLDLNYDQSLFERMMKCDYPVNILKVQYRMHPQISHVIGKSFYGSQLINGEKNESFTPTGDLPSAFMMFHLEGSYEESKNCSYVNVYEAKFIQKLAQYIEKNCYDVGIVSPYSQQVGCIQGHINSKTLQIRTIDSFQGRQKEIIILSTVRSRYFGEKRIRNKRRTIGFVSDMRRINVSLSRAKENCIIVGDLKRLAINKIWKDIITEAIMNEQVYEVKDPSKTTIASIFKNKKKHLMKDLNIDALQRNPSQLSR